MVELLERFDSHAALRNGLRLAADDMGTWCGIPMPLDGEELIIEPSYPKAAELMAICKMPLPGEAAVAEGEKLKASVRSTFYSMHKRADIVIFNKPDGKVDWGLLPPMHPADMLLRTMGCSEAWGVEQEGKAIQLLGTLLPHHAFKKYLLSGSFVERSPRSGVTYVFRKLRPTLALRVNKERVEVMCALCLHPIGLYAGSFAGAMCASDDVIAHLVLMRGDEHMFWKRSNQHPSWMPQAGIFA